MKKIFILGIMVTVGATALARGGELRDVTLFDFPRAETDRYFASYVANGKLGALTHSRKMAPIDGQNVVRMNRDTLYSSGVFDLEAGPVTVTLPETEGRYMSMQVISEDHYTLDVVYAPGQFVYDKDRVGIRYVFLLVRTLANPVDEADLEKAHESQDAIRVEQAASGKWDVPVWDEASRKEIRDALAILGAHTGLSDRETFGRADEVDPVMHLIGTSIGWGGNPREAAVYESRYPEKNDGKTPFELRVLDVPVDGFWSVSVYNREGYFQKNDRNAYSVNNLTAEREGDGSVLIRFVGDPEGAGNYLPITPEWNYTVRLYRPRQSAIDDSWEFPQAVPAH